MDNKDAATERPTWVEVRENPENLNFGIEDVVAVNVPWYRLNPPSEEFKDFSEFRVSVGVCGEYDHDFPSRPDECADVVLLGINGLQGSRLVNLLIAPDSARQLAKLLKRAAKKVAR